MVNYVVYRISDTGYKKVKPDYINNENCLKNAINMFPNFIFYIIYLYIIYFNLNYIQSFNL